MQTEPRITIAICTYNRAPYLQDTLDDLAVQDAPAEETEIVVINNNSKDDTRKVGETFETLHPGINFRMVVEKRQGLSHARNRAIEEARAPVLLFIDDDVLLTPSYIRTVLTHLDTYPDVRCAGGRILVSFDDQAGGQRPAWIPSELMPMFGLHDLGDKIKPYPKGNFPRGGNMLIFKSLFDQFGTFDTRLGRTGSKLLGSEEKAFFEHIRNKGATLCYWPGMELTHRIGSDRLTENYLRKQSAGIGESEGRRVRNSGRKILGKGLSETGKILISLILSLGYLLKGEFKAALFLMKFRIWVLQGFMEGAALKSERRA